MLHLFVLAVLALKDCQVLLRQLDKRCYIVLCTRVLHEIAEVAHCIKDFEFGDVCVILKLLSPVFMCVFLDNIFCLLLEDVD